MTESKFFTVGYEGLSIKRFIEALSEAGVTALVDVRDRAQSRKKGFSKTALANSLELVGIQYVHMRALGDPKNGREAARAGRVNEFKAIFSEVMESEAAKSAVETLLKISKTEQACLLCYERDPKHCHRTLILSIVAKTHAVCQCDIQINENSIAYETTRRVPYPYKSIAA